jgi:hypothetical protein
MRRGSTAEAELQRAMVAESGGAHLHSTHWTRIRPEAQLFG